MEICWRAHILQSIPQGTITQIGSKFRCLSACFPFWAIHGQPPELIAFFCPGAQLLLMESELLVASQYLRALMQKKMVCKSKEERGQFCDRLLQDATQLRELFCSLVRDA